MLSDNESSPYAAAIFDMDGLLVDSTPHWKTAEREVFGGLGFPVSDELQVTTATMTTREVAEFWFNRHPWDGDSLEDVESAVVTRVGELVASAGEMPGVSVLLRDLRRMRMRIGLASNAPLTLCTQILDQLGLGNWFDHIQSSDLVARGKPDPAVYLAAADAMSVEPARCIAFEDSLVGAQAARAAGMRVIVVPTQAEEIDQCISIGAMILRSLEDVDETFWHDCR